MDLAGAGRHIFRAKTSVGFWDRTSCMGPIEMNVIENGEEKAKERLLSSFDYLLSHNGSGHLEVNTKILKRGQREVTIQCSRCHRYVVDMKEEEGGK